MSGKPAPGDSMSANFAGMSKNQLYDIMCQMKQLIDQNQQQARQILVQNPLLTRALFQAQIMLGMLQTPQAVPSNQPPVSQNPQSTQLAPKPVIQASLPPQGPVGFPDQPSVQAQMSARQVQRQPMPGIHDAVPDITLPSSSISSQLPPLNQQAAGHLNIQMPQRPNPHASQATNVPPSGYYSTPQQSSHQSQLPIASNPYTTNNMLHPSMQPPLPPQPRPTSQPNFLHQPSQQMGSGFHHSNAPQMHQSQSSFHPAKPPSSLGPPFAHGQASPQLNQQQPQSLYQGGSSRFRPDTSNLAAMQVDRGTPWASVIPENPSVLPGPPPLALNHPMAPVNQAPRPPPPPMTPEMENALLQQVMSLTPEQINVLPPDQRQQVHQLQQMLRQ